MPYVSVIFCAAFGLLAYMSVGTNSGQVFGWFQNMTAVAGMMTWFGISVSYIRFYQGLKAQGYDRKSLPFTSRFQPYAAYYAAFWTFFICLVGQLDIFQQCLVN